MKISFLIPSKNRLHLLRLAVSTILAQDWRDLEIVVSDNASSEDYHSYIAEISDPRIVYYRQEAPVSVTENWKAALALSTGDYILMLGDDDALAPNFSECVRPFLSSDKPDVVFLAAYHYCYPMVLDANPSGYLAIVRNSEFLLHNPGPFCLTQSYARELAASILDFRYRFGFNAQYFLLKATFVKEFAAKGGIYQSPYPDTFAAFATFMHARSVVVVPTEAVIIGISPKSFGYYYFSNRHREGYEFLNNEGLNLDVRESLLRTILPGDRNNTNWLVAAEVARRVIAPCSGLSVNVDRYRSLQIISVLRDRYLSGISSGEADLALMEKLTAGEVALFELLETAIKTAVEFDGALAGRVIEAMRERLAQFVPAEVTFLDIGPHKDVGDAFAWLARKHADQATCPYCGESSRQQFVARDWNQKSTTEAFAYRQCGSCGLTFINPMPEDLHKYYVHEQYDIPASGDNFELRAQSQGWKLDLLKPFVTRGDLLEVGPATGEFATLARRMGFKPTLIEMNRECCSFLRDVLEHNVIESDAPLGCLHEDDIFDAICVWQAIEHIPKFWEFMAEAARHLRAGGVFAISTPNPVSFQAQLMRARWPHADAPRHLYLVPPKWFEHACRAWGLRVVKVTTRDEGSIGLNYYGWFLWLRNHLGRYLSHNRVSKIAAVLTNFFKPWEIIEGKGCSYVLVMVKEQPVKT